MPNLLVLSGGGSYGAFEMGIVSRLIEDENYSWDVVTGVSAGSINASYLSTIDKNDIKNHISEFQKLWTSIKSSDIYSPDFFLNGLSVFETKKLKSTLENIFENRKLLSPLIISATSLSNGTAQHFTNTDFEKYGFTDLIMSSTAIPLLFPPHSFLNDMFVDGGLTSNILLYEGINYCLENFPKEDINIKVVICGKKISPQKINDTNINLKILLSQLLSIIKEQIEYFQILEKISNPDNVKINITVYEQKDSSDISLLDFEKCDILWKQGYDFSNVHTYQI
jgi:predicted acylesterase/phospholipase RssA